MSNEGTDRRTLITAGAAAAAGGLLASGSAAAVAQAQAPSKSGLLAGKVAVVTGAGTGIGEAIAHRFAVEGARVIVAGMPAGPIRNVTAAIRSVGGEAEPYIGDLSEDRHARGAIRASVERYGDLDVLVNNASISGGSSPLADYDLDVFDDVIRCNLRSAFLMTRAAIPELRKRRGNILFSGSAVGIKGAPTFAPYSATKAWYHNFAQALAGEEAPHGIRVNAVAIGVTDTAWSRADLGGVDGAAAGRTLPIQRMATVEEMAQVFAMLASDRSSYVTGSVWQAEGGMVIAHGQQGPSQFAAAPASSLPLRHTFDGLRDRWWQANRDGDSRSAGGRS